MERPTSSPTPGTPGPTAARVRLAATAAAIVLTVLIGGGLLATILGYRLPPAAGAPRPLSDVLSKTIETGGIEAALAQYRSLRAQGFPGLLESESDTNRLGYRLLGKDDTRSAIEVFRLNVEAHPASANVYDSLGEAYLAAGDSARAAESYRQALVIDPTMKSANAELQRLTDFKRPPLPSLVLFHVTAGMLGIASGALAVLLRKGSRRHALAGRVFTVAMLGMSASGALRAVVGPVREPINVLMGALTFYLVATAWRAARRRTESTDLLDWAGLLAAAAVATGLVRLGLADRRFGPVLLLFAAVATMAAALDLRMIVRGGVSGSARVVRHLWRMCTALYIGVSSLFLGQPQVFPYAVRRTGVLVVPNVLVLAVLVYWLIRTLATRGRSRAAAAKADLVADPIAT
jgi:tetratricopeptide (TPR) repeat protein